MKHGVAVFCDFLIQHVIRLVKRRRDSVFGTYRNAMPAAHTVVMVDGGLAVRDGDGIACTVALAGTAADASVLIDERFAAGMHFHLARARAAAHTDVLQAAAKARGAVALKVGQGDEYVGCLLYTSSTNNGGSGSRARAKEISCFWPVDRRLPPSPTWV